MTTIGRGSTTKIAAACDDGTVRIYDSVTGVLKLSLRPKFPVQELTGLPDGSLLVCSHSGRPLITLWDIQTGGLVETFTLQREAEHTAVSLNGHYLACETSSRGTTYVLETARKTQKPTRWEQLSGNTPCWLAPEELIMVVDSRSACIRNVATKGPPVHKFDISGSFHNAVYSQVLDRLAIMSRCSHGGTSFTILDVKTGTASTLHTSGERLSSIAFSQTAKQFVCGGEAPGLETVDISTGRRTCFNFPDTATSVSTLSNGTVVANFRDSGIQLLDLGQEHAPSQQPTPPSLTMYPLDEGRIISIVPTTDDRVVLLKTANMSQVLSIPAQKGRSVATDHTVVLCASLKNKIAVRCYRERFESYLQRWEFYHRHPRWTVQTERCASIGSISPFCARLVTFHNEDRCGFFAIWDARDGRSLSLRPFEGWKSYIPRPLDITFNSEDRFSSHYDTYQQPYIINTAHQAGDYSIIPYEGQWLNREVLEGGYCLDDSHEWVIRGSQRICWVPPGYIGSAPADHFWVGSSLVMLGQDGMLRRLTFLESSL